MGLNMGSSIQKKPRVLGITWDDLISCEEQKVESIDAIRIALCDYLAHQNEGFTCQFQILYDKHRDHFWKHQTSDFCVILYRLLSQFSNGILANYFIKISDYPPDDMSLAAFCSMVKHAFSCKQKPVPLMLGITPGVIL
jgi:hypothetical protein